MDYNFDRIIDRTQTYDLKWNRGLAEANLQAPVPADFVPMWIADTDFACAPHIVRAVQTRAAKEIYGYCAPLAPFTAAVGWWTEHRFGWKVAPAAITALPSVVAGINIAIRACSEPGDGVIIQPPVYDPFSTIVRRTQRKLVSNTLLCIDGQYEMDFPLLEQQAADPANKVMILCSPHNPVGRVWTQAELRRVAEICLANNVVLVSDEIHADIVYEGYQHHPILSLDPRYADHFIHLMAPSKTFNVPGLKISVAVIPNAALKKKFDETQLSLSLDVRNTFGLEGLIAAYSAESEPWVAAEIAYLQENIRFMQQFLQENLPQVTMQAPQGTFLCWLDCTALGLPDMELVKKVATQAGVICVPGPWFGEGGAQHLRFNVGCTRATLQRALERTAQVLNG